MKLPAVGSRQACEFRIPPDLAQRLQAAAQRSELRKAKNAAFRSYRSTVLAKERAIRDGRTEAVTRLSVLEQARLLAFQLLEKQVQDAEAQAKP